MLGTPDSDIAPGSEDSSPQSQASCMRFVKGWCPKAEDSDSPADRPPLLDSQPCMCGGMRITWPSVHACAGAFASIWFLTGRSGRVPPKFGRMPPNLDRARPKVGPSRKNSGLLQPGIRRYSAHVVPHNPKLTDPAWIPPRVWASLA